MEISKYKTLTRKVVFVDGLTGCGKTLFSPIIAALDKVELLSYSYEIENYCALYFLKELNLNTAKSQVRLTADLKLYNTMMGREVNFRPSDLSSVLKSHDPSIYFKRIFDKGDEEVPDIIKRKDPILNLTTHQLLAHSEPIWEAFGKDCVFIEVIRHPLYMIRQSILNEQNVYGTDRCFDVYFKCNKMEIPYYVNGYEDEYMTSNSEERAILYLKYLSERTNVKKEEFRQRYNAKIITIPFENYVINPDKFMIKIADFLETNISNSTKAAMNSQNVPRDKVANGVDLDIYRRCGWEPPSENFTEIDELRVRRDEVSKSVRPKFMEYLDKLSNDYEHLHWSPNE